MDVLIVGSETKTNVTHKYSTLVVNNLWSNTKSIMALILRIPSELEEIPLSPNRLEKVTELPEKKIITTKCL